MLFTAHRPLTKKHSSIATAREFLQRTQRNHRTRWRYTHTRSQQWTGREGSKNTKHRQFSQPINRTPILQPVNQIKPHKSSQLSDDDDSGGEETDPALVEEEYTRTPPMGSAEGRGALPPRPSTLRLSLVNSRHSLWGHRLWNAALLLAGMYADIAYKGGYRCTTVSPPT